MAAQQYKAAVATRNAQQGAFNSCLAELNAGNCQLTFPRTDPGPAPVPVPAVPNADPAPDPADPNNPADPIPAVAPPPVTITPEQAAYEAFVKVKLVAPTPNVGPPPSINQWKMAAVGYPLWLWTTGDTDPPAVTDAVGGLFVSLDPKVSKTVFAMGDGTTVTCSGKSRPWTRAVPAGQKSPNCGHAYTEPSLPKGSYTITATTHWAVDWNANGQTGTIPFTQTATTTLPVGEIQVLVR